MVERFHADGATVFTIDKNAEQMTELKKSLPGVTAKTVDVSDWDATKKVVESFGVIDHLVNNAGFTIPQTFLNITKEAADGQFKVLLLGVVNVSQVVAKKLIAEKREGSIVNIASITGRRPKETSVVYSAMKACVENLTKSMAVELGQHNIRVTAIAPGLVDTAIIRQGGATDEQVRQFIEHKLVIKRKIETNEIADLASFLLSPLASMIVGETVVIDGGLLLK